MYDLPGVYPVRKKNFGPFNEKIWRKLDKKGNCPSCGGLVSGRRCTVCGRFDMRAGKKYGRLRP